VTGNITANLKDVTLFEALDAVRELYGYDYKVEGTRIYIRPLTMQTKMFKINYWWRYGRVQPARVVDLGGQCGYQQ
jgi:hypothetical protein